MKNALKMFAFFTVIAIVLTGCNKEEEELLAPEMGETKIMYITDNSATLKAELTDEGDENVTDNGVCWSTSSEPTINDDAVEASDYEDFFTAELEDLTEGTEYYARGYATSDAGTSYGEEITFSTTTPVEDIDGNSYPTVQIGDQIWMAENLKTTTYNDGSSITHVSDEDTWSDLTTAAYCWWENDDAEADDHWGAYYNYYTVATGNLAPEGWHVPTEEEWNALDDFIDGDADKLKHTGSSTFGDNNQTNFNAYMAGYRGGGNGVFARRSEWTLFWIAGDEPSETNTYADVKFLEDGSISVQDDQFSMQTGASIRCIKD
ncbi:MAG: fibrobacter succinogenes major paralogous domain-containing protein [Bacteroidota bacterium]